MRADIRGIGLANRCSHCASPTDMFNDLRLCEELFHTACGNAYADFITDCHRETWPIRSKRFQKLVAALLLPSNRAAPGAAVLSPDLVHVSGSFDSARVCQI
jgi:hypothetical protein